jgi:hypothetical protein
MHFGTTVAYRRVNLRCGRIPSEVLHAVKIVVCISPKETMMKHKAHKILTVSILASSIYNVYLIHRVRGDPNFNIACGIEGCYSTFTA